MSFSSENPVTDNVGAGADFIKDQLDFVKSLFDGRSRLVVSVEYKEYCSDYVDDIGHAFPGKLQVEATSVAEYLSFFKKVAGYMRCQCDMAASSEDLQIALPPVFQIEVYNIHTCTRQAIHSMPFREKFHRELSAYRIKY